MKLSNKLSIVKTISFFAISSTVLITGVSTSGVATTNKLNKNQQDLKNEVEEFLYSKKYTQRLSKDEYIELTVKSNQEKITTFTIGHYTFTFKGEKTLSEIGKGIDIDLTSVSKVIGGEKVTLTLENDYKLINVKGIAAKRTWTKKESVEKFTTVVEKARITEFKADLPTTIKTKLLKKEVKEGLKKQEILFGLMEIRKTRYNDDNKLSLTYKNNTSLLLTEKTLTSTFTIKGYTFTIKRTNLSNLPNEIILKSVSKVINGETVTVKLGKDYKLIGVKGTKNKITEFKSLVINDDKLIKKFEFFKVTIFNLYFQNSFHKKEYNNNKTWNLSKIDKSLLGGFQVVKISDNQGKLLAIRYTDPDWRNNFSTNIYFYNSLTITIVGDYLKVHLSDKIKSEINKLFRKSNKIFNKVIKNAIFKKKYRFDHFYSATHKDYKISVSFSKQTNEHYILLISLTDTMYKENLFCVSNFKTNLFVLKQIKKGIKEYKIIRKRPKEFIIEAIKELNSKNDSSKLRYKTISKDSDIAEFSFKNLVWRINIKNLKIIGIYNKKIKFLQFNVNTFSDYKITLDRKKLKILYIKKDSSVIKKDSSVIKKDSSFIIILSSIFGILVFIVIFYFLFTKLITKKKK